MKDDERRKDTQMHEKRRYGNMRGQREDRRRHALEIVSGGYGWGDATKIIENTYKVSRRTAIRDVDLAFEGIVESLEKSDVKALMGWITLGVQRNIMKAEQQNNHGAVISGYRLLYEMIIKPKENQGKRTWRNYRGV